MIEKQTDSAAKIATLRKCTPQSGINASLFSMPNLVKPQDTHCVEDRTTNISCLTTSSQKITYSQAIGQTTVNVYSVRLVNRECVCQTGANGRIQRGTEIIWSGRGDSSPKVVGRSDADLPGAY